MILALLLACQSSGPELRTLEPYENPFGPTDPLWSEQPRRENPLEVAVAADGRVWVSLQGSPDNPGTQVAVVDLDSGEVVRLETGGAGTTGLAMHPNGDFVVAFNRFSNFATVFDTRTDSAIAQIPTDFYAIEGVFTPDGDELWLTNRWRDAVSVWELNARDQNLEVKRRHEAIVSVDTNPRDIAISADGRSIAVAALTGSSVSVIDTETRAERARVDLGAPVNDVAFASGYLVAATLSASTHHQPFDGPDTDGDGLPGDGTPNVNFQDLQNELAVIDPDSGAVLWRYTSDTLCCADYRDVDPLDIDRFGDLLPPTRTWMVEGALPEQITVRGGELWVAYSASNEVQRFTIDPVDGSLSSHGTWSTSGHNPHGLVVHGEHLLVAHRLSETLGVYDRTTGRAVAEHVVGDVNGGDFPATDAEIGELFNFVTAPFTVDGDQSCSHCHREGNNIDKAFSMPLTRYPGVGSRMTMAYRGAFDTRPWFMESAFDETNFKPVMNEFARIENFCCSDYTMWPDGPPANCENDPPPECSDLNTGSDDGFAASMDAVFRHPRPTDEPTRDTFYVARAADVIGRTQSFGDGVYSTDPITLERGPIDLDFDGITRALGLFLLADTHLLPNPNPPDSDEASEGRALFERTDTGCSTCHSGPGFAASNGHNPFSLPIRMAPVVSANRAEDGTNLDLFASGFMDAFPTAEQEACDDICDPQLCEEDTAVCDDLREVRFGATTLRGIWDRAPSLYHDGRAQGLLEALATPGHPALADDQQGFNERDGVIDTHGGTSQLSARELNALMRYLETL